MRYGGGAAPRADPAGLRTLLADRVSTSPDDLLDAAEDFGHQVHHRPAAVVRPRRATDVAAAVTAVRSGGLPLAVRGGGHSVDGQTLVPGGVVVDLSALDRVERIGADRIVVGAGARWRTVVTEGAARELTPPVLPDYLDLTVGGTLSIGGLGGASHRHGSLADMVLELEVVTPDGRVRHCSPTRHPELFTAVRASRGAAGILTRATLPLIPVTPRLRRHRLRYHDLRRFLEDQRRVVLDGRFDHVDGLVAGGPGERCFVMHAARPEDHCAAPLGDLGDDRGLREEARLSHHEFVTRFDPVAERLRASGAWSWPHPRCTVLLPGRRAAELVARTLDGLTDELLGEGGSVLLYSIRTAALRVAPLRVADDPVTVLLGIQRTARPGDGETIERMVAANRELVTRARAVGGVAYPGP